MTTGNSLNRDSTEPRRKAGVLTPLMPQKSEDEPAITPDELVSELQAGARVLDVGCGHGSFNYIAHPEVEIHACDILPPTPVPDLPNVHYRQLAAEDLDHPPQSFDLIVLNFVLEHAKDPPRILDLCRDILKPSGILYCSVPNSRHFEDRLFRGFDRFLKIITLKPFEPVEHAQCFTEESLIAVAAHSALQPVARSMVPAGFGWLHGFIEGSATSRHGIRERIKSAVCRILLGWVFLWLRFHRITGQGDPRRGADILYTFRKADMTPSGEIKAHPVTWRIPERVFTHSCGRCGLPVNITREQREDAPRARKWLCPRCGKLNIL